MEGRLEYEITSLNQNKYINLAHDISSLGSKSHGATTKKGELLTYVCDITLVSNGGAGVNVYTAKENWVTKNSFKKWHVLREFMFKEAGIKGKERGRYSGILRPFFDPFHSAGAGSDDLKPKELEMVFDPVAEEWNWDEGSLGRGDWVYTDLVTETNPDLPGGVLETDMFDIHICGPTVSSMTTGVAVDQAISSAGMIQSYMSDRSHPTAEPVDTVESKLNPLALLKGRSESTGETVALAAAEAAGGPPYDTAHDGSMINPVLAGFLNTTSDNIGVHSAYGVRVPAGLLMIQADAASELKVTVRRVEICRA